MQYNIIKLTEKRRIVHTTHSFIEANAVGLDFSRQSENKDHLYVMEYGDRALKTYQNGKRFAA